MGLSSLARQKRGYWWPDVAIALLLLSAVFVVLAEGLLPNTTFISNYDIEYFYAHETVLNETASWFTFPLWNPYFGGGAPTLSRIQIGLYYPPLVLLRAIFSPAQTLNYTSLLHIYLAGLGVYWLLRDLGSSPFGAAFGAITFMFGGSIMPRVLAGHISVIHSIAWVGWLLLFYRRLLRFPSSHNLFLSVLFVSLTILGGHPQMSATALLVPFFYFAAFAFEKIRTGAWARLWLAFSASILVVVLALGVSSMQLFPFFDWFQHTGRGQGIATVTTDAMIMRKQSLAIRELPTVLAPFLWVNTHSRALTEQIPAAGFFWEKAPFLGILPLLIIAMGATRQQTKERPRIWFLAAMALFGLLMSMGHINPIYNVLGEVAPYIRAPGRFLLLWSISGALLAGICFDNLLFLDSSVRLPIFRRAIRGWNIVTFVGIGILVVWNLIGRQMIMDRHAPGLSRDVIINGFTYSIHVSVATVILIRILLWLGLRRTGARQWSMLAIIIVFAELFFFSLPLVEPKLISDIDNSSHPLAILRPAASEIRIDGRRLPPVYGVPTLAHVTNGEEHAHLDNLLKLPERLGQKLLAAGYRVTKEPLSEDAGLELIRHADNAYLYRENGTVPRIYVVPTVRLASTDEEALSLIGSGLFDPLQVAVVTTDEPSPSIEPVAENLATTLSASADYLHYGSDRLTARVAANAAAMVVFSEMYYPGWRATVDGMPVTVWNVNYAFRGIVIHEGIHTIEMTFRSQAYEEGMQVSLVTAALIFISNVVIYLLTFNKPGQRRITS